MHSKKYIYILRLGRWTATTVAVAAVVLATTVAKNKQENTWAQLYAITASIGHPKMHLQVYLRVR